MASIAWLRNILVITFAAAVYSYDDEPITMHINEGETFTLPCKNNTPGRFLGLVWKSEQELYKFRTDRGISVHPVFSGRSRLVQETSLRVKSAKISDPRIYFCFLLFYDRTPSARLGSHIILVIHAKPNITSLTPVMQYPAMNSGTTIKCAVLGYPYANITWMHDENKDLTGKIFTESNVTSTVTSIMSTLTLDALRKSDSGHYTCTAHNRAGSTTKRASLRVRYPPTVKLKPHVHVNVDATGKITCKATGFPIPAIDWKIRTTDIVLDLSSGESYKRKFTVSEIEEDSRDVSSVSHLFINSVEVNDWRSNFTCLAHNNVGSANKKATIGGYDKPGRPTIIKVTPFPDRVTIQWSPPSDGGTKILAYVVEYKNATQPQWISREIRPANVDRYKIMDLLPNSFYNFRLYAKNAVGDGPFSKEYTLSTSSSNKNRHFYVTPRPSRKDSTVPKENETILGSFGVTAMIGVFAGVFLFLVLIIVIVFFLFRKVQKTANSQTASIPGSRPVSMENGTLLRQDSRRPSERPSEIAEFIPLMTRTDHWEFPRDRLRLSTVLGSGAFGMVMRGDAQGIRGSSGSVKVAVKIAKDTDNEHARKDLSAELDMLKLLPEHPNVVGLLGCCTRSEPLMIIVEYCAHGDLQGFLRSSRGISEQYYKKTYHPIGQKMTSKMLLDFAWQVAKGMNHLSSFKVIHRDLASRNILVDEHLVCKISDFGFARDIYVENQYMKKSQGGRFPIKWMAPESLLDGISTSKSDVWSFGVVLWEIVTLGASPYPGMNSYEVVSFLQDGYRMDKPKHCTDEIYAVSMDCWHKASQRRPTFEDLANRLKELLDDEKEFINMNFYEDHLYENFDVNLGFTSSANNSAVEFNTSETAPLTPAGAVAAGPSC